MRILLNRLRQQQKTYKGAIQITIAASQVVVNQTDWTLVIDQSFSSVLTEVNGILDADGSDPCLADGGDIVMALDRYGSNRIPVDLREIAINNDPSLGKLELACKIPTVSSSTDTIIYLLWNGTQSSQPAASDTYGQYNAYDSYYTLISPAGGDDDRTSYQHTGTADGATAADSLGLVGKATEYNGTNSIHFGNSIDLKPETGDYTIEFCTNVDVDSSTIKPDFISDRMLGDAEGITIGQCGKVGTNVMSYLVTPEAPIDNKFYYQSNFYTAAEGWFTIGMTIDNSANQMLCFKNGADITSTLAKDNTNIAGKDISSTDNLVISGRPGSTGRRIDGLMGETRISKGIKRSSVWMSLDHKNLTKEVGFLTFSNA